VKTLDCEWIMNFLSVRNIFLIPDAFKDEVWTDPEDSGKVREETHFTTKGKEEILIVTSEENTLLRFLRKEKRGW